MYKCDKCGYVFEEPIERREDPSPAGVSLSGGHYTYYYCPKCSSEEITAVVECVNCGAYIEEGEVLCEDCMEEFREKLAEIGKEMSMDQDELEDVIYQIYR